MCRVPKFHSSTTQALYDKLDAEAQSRIGLVLQRIADYRDLFLANEHEKASRMHSLVHNEIKALAEEFADSSGAVTGGAVAGAAAGFLVGGPVGAAIGGLVGGYAASASTEERRQTLLRITQGLRVELEATPEQRPDPGLATASTTALAPSNSLPVSAAKPKPSAKELRRTRMLPSTQALPKPTLPTPGRRVSLFVTNGAARGTKLTLSGQTVSTLGRADDNSIPLPDDASISNYHAELMVKDGSFFVRDLKSTNGTRIGQRLIEPSVWVHAHANDTLQFGETVLRVAVEQ